MCVLQAFKDPFPFVHHSLLLGLPLLVGLGEMIDVQHEKAEDDRQDD